MCALEWNRRRVEQPATAILAAATYLLATYYLHAGLVWVRARRIIVIAGQPADSTGVARFAPLNPKTSAQVRPGRQTGGKNELPLLSRRKEERARRRFHISRRESFLALVSPPAKNETQQWSARYQVKRRSATIKELPKVRFGRGARACAPVTRWVDLLHLLHLLHFVLARARPDNTRKPVLLVPSAPDQSLTLALAH